MILDVNNLTHTFAGPAGAVRALDGATFSVDAGEFVVVVGPSGSGKTTLLLAAGALLRPTGGRIRVGGTDPYALGPEARARFRGEKIGFVFQQFHLVPYLSVLDNVLAASLARPRPDAEPRARELAARFNLAHRMDHRPAALSTGECQRVALARALLNEPALILADEPTGNLDRENAKVVVTHLADAARAGRAVLMVTHDERALETATRSLRIEDGQVSAG
ncbi:MAG: ABC transporter ATP-binding protein [Kiritimatiellae bacterium]|nr:ABC transporter ATP-binding protein [Kiritimatiellia bacterium]